MQPDQQTLTPIDRCRLRGEDLFDERDRPMLTEAITELDAIHDRLNALHRRLCEVHHFPPFAKTTSHILTALVRVGDAEDPLRQIRGDYDREDGDVD